MPSSSSTICREKDTHVHEEQEQDEEGITTSVSNLVYPITLVTDDTTTKTTIPWSDRLKLQNTWTLSQKGWQVPVEWKVSPRLLPQPVKEQEQHGCSSYNYYGVFAKQPIIAGAILRIGILHSNVIQFQSIHDIESFCQGYSVDNNNDDDDINNRSLEQQEYTERLQYVQDYLWGCYPSSRTDAMGYPNKDSNVVYNTTTSATTSTSTDDDSRFIGMWIPGNGLNHNTEPNTVYRNNISNHCCGNADATRNNNTNTGTDSSCCIYLIALTDIPAGEELFDDYRRHGTTAPPWLKRYAMEKKITLNFADCNDFVQ